MRDEYLTRVLCEARQDPATYRAFVLLPDRERYASLADVERHLSHDVAALDALHPHLQASDRGAWNLLLIGFSRLLVSWCRFVEIDVVFVLIVEAVKAAKPIAPYVYWGIVHHARSEARKQQHTAKGAHEQDCTTGESSDGPVLTTVPADTDPLLREQINGGLEALPEPRRRAVLLRLEGHNAAEIARHMGTTSSTIRQHLTRARSALVSLREERL